MIPSTSWEPWEPLRSRSLRYAMDSAVEISRKLGFGFTPGELHGNFAIHESAFLNATAIAFGVSRADVDAGLAGAIMWRVTYRRPDVWSAACAGYEADLPIGPRRWDQGYREWMAEIINLSETNTSI